MKHNIVKNWIESFELMTSRSYVMKPFLIMGFIEAFALIAIYFATGFPLRFMASPVIAKLFGPTAIHYPGNVTVIPKVFYYAQTLIFVVAGILLYAIAVDLIKGVRPRKIEIDLRTTLEHVLRRYMSFFVYGVIAVAVSLLAKNYGMVLFKRILHAIARYLPMEALKILPTGAATWIFFLRIFLDTFLILTVPIIVIKNRPVIKALFESAFCGIVNFFTIFIMIAIPYLIYLPLLLLKSAQMKLANHFFPEIIFILTIISIFAYKLIECFVCVCVSRFVLQREAAVKIKANQKKRR